MEKFEDAVERILDNVLSSNMSVLELETFINEGREIRQKSPNKIFKDSNTMLSFISGKNILSDVPKNLAETRLIIREKLLDISPTIVFKANEFIKYAVLEHMCCEIIGEEVPLCSVKIIEYLELHMDGKSMFFERMIPIYEKIPSLTGDAQDFDTETKFSILERIGIKREIFNSKSLIALEMAFDIIYTQCLRLLGAKGKTCQYGFEESRNSPFSNDYLFEVGPSVVNTKAIEMHKESLLITIDKDIKTFNKIIKDYFQLRMKKWSHTDYLFLDAIATCKYAKILMMQGKKFKAISEIYVGKDKLVSVMQEYIPMGSQILDIIILLFDDFIMSRIHKATPMFRQFANLAAEYKYVFDQKDCKTLMQMNAYHKAMFASDKMRDIIDESGLLVKSNVMVKGGVRGILYTEPDIYDDDGRVRGFAFNRHSIFPMVKEYTNITEVINGKEFRQYFVSDDDLLLFSLIISHAFRGKYIFEIL